jgi:hypothetical protein
MAQVQKGTHKDIDPVSEVEVSDPANPLKRHAFLLTLYVSQESKDVSFVMVQASHCNKTKRFADLATALAYLEATIHPSL